MWPRVGARACNRTVGARVNPTSMSAHPPGEGSGASAGAQVICVGSCNMDLVASVPSLPRPGQTVLGTSFTTACGGKGANQAVAAAKFGAKVCFVGKVGDEEYGRRTRANFERCGVAVDHLLVDPSATTGVASILVDASGENCIAVIPGANAALTAAEASASLLDATGSGVLLVQNEVAPAASLAALSAAYAAGITTVVNAAPASATFAADTFPFASVACVNESEAETITGVAVVDAASADRACRAMTDMGARAVVITAGASGAFVAESGTGAGVAHVPAPSLAASPGAAVVDTVGAGDCFCGVLAVRLAAGDTLRRATAVAAAAATYSVQRPGAQASYPTAAELGAV